MKDKQPIRQGDVCLIPVTSLPKDAKPVASQERVVLAFGEITGHAHAIYDTTKARLWDSGVERFLQVLERCELKHEEHSAVALMPGVYYLPQQVEYAPKELRRVTD